jgi:long-chain acyl-CoA synthetase
MPVKTIPALFDYIERCSARPDLLSYHTPGSWTAISTEEFAEAVRSAAAGLLQLGVKTGENIGIISNSSPLWVMADFAIQLAGCITVPIFRRISPENLEFEIKDSGLRTVFIGDPNEVEPVKRCGGRKIKTIVTMGFTVDERSVVSFEDLKARGASFLAAHPVGSWPGARAAGDDPATVIYTSGSTGVPKGVLLTHRNLISQILAASRVFPLYKKDKALTSLPLSHIFERMVMYFYLFKGVAVHFVDDLQNIGALVREVRPTIMTTVPRLLEKIYAKMRNTIEEERGIRRRIGLAALKRAEEKNVDTPYSGLRDFVYKRLVYSRLNNALGGAFRYVISGSAPLAQYLGRFFINIGLPLYEGYGLTEASPVLAANFPGNRKLGSVGRAFPGVSLRIDPRDHEILARGPNIMLGYRNNPAETAAALGSDGYLHTGDMGRIDARGFLTITGRKKELLKKSTGEYVAPVPIEQALQKLDIVDSALVIAESRKFVSCLIFPDMEAVKELRKRSGNGSVSTEEFLAGNLVRAKIKTHIDEVNKHVHHSEEILKFTIITAPISVEGGELTPTMKIRRFVIEEKFKEQIEAMYHEHIRAEGRLP